VLRPANPTGGGLLTEEDLRRSIAVQVPGFDDRSRLTLLRRLYRLPVRQARALPSAYFSFAVTRDTLAVRPTLPLAG